MKVNNHFLLFCRCDRRLAPQQETSRLSADLPTRLIELSKTLRAILPTVQRVIDVSEEMLFLVAGILEVAVVCTRAHQTIDHALIEEYTHVEVRC